MKQSGQEIPAQLTEWAQTSAFGQYQPKFQDWRDPDQPEEVQGGQWGEDGDGDGWGDGGDGGDGGGDGWGDAGGDAESAKPAAAANDGWGNGAAQNDGWGNGNSGGGGGWD